jgi:hypothetical protein
MSNPTPPPDERRQRSIAAVATFTTLMHAYERSELTTAAEAQAQLAHLGVVVRFTRTAPRQRKGADHA